LFVSCFFPSDQELNTTILRQKTHKFDAIYLFVKASFGRNIIWLCRDKIRVRLAINLILINAISIKKIDSQFEHRVGPFSCFEVVIRQIQREAKMKITSLNISKPRVVQYKGHGVSTGICKKAVYAFPPGSNWPGDNSCHR